jgi:hypothetical protein
MLGCSFRLASWGLLMIRYTQRFVLGIMLFVVAQRTELSAAVFDWASEAKAAWPKSSSISIPLMVRRCGVVVSNCVLSWVVTGGVISVVMVDGDLK